MTPLASGSRLARAKSGATGTRPTVAVYSKRAITRASLAALLRDATIEVVVLREEPRLPGHGAPPGRPVDVVLCAGPEPDPELTLRLVGAHRAPLLLLLDQAPTADAWPISGARGAVCRECPPERLLEAIEAVAAGEDYFECPSHLPEPAPAPLLSARERRVATELARGAQIEEIAELLCISPHTARTHVRNIRRKLGARTSAHAVAVAITMGLVAG